MSVCVSSVVVALRPLEVQHRPHLRLHDQHLLTQLSGAVLEHGQRHDGFTPSRIGSVWPSRTRCAPVRSWCRGECRLHLHAHGSTPWRASPPATSAAPDCSPHTARAEHLQHLRHHLQQLTHPAPAGRTAPPLSRPPHTAASAAPSAPASKTAQGRLDGEDQGPHPPLGGVQALVGLHGEVVEEGGRLVGRLTQQPQLTGRELICTLLRGGDEGGAAWRPPAGCPPSELVQLGVGVDGQRVRVGVAVDCAARRQDVDALRLVVVSGVGGAT